MSSRGGLDTLSQSSSTSAKKPVFTQIVKESLKSIILSGESDLDIFVSHHILYFLGYLTGWNTKIFSLEFLPLIYFFIWSIVLFSLKEIQYGLLFFISFVLIMLYFILLHTTISSWDRIRHWFIRKARKRGGVKNMTLEDIKFLLIYTRKVFGVKASVEEEFEEDFDSEYFRKILHRYKIWQHILTYIILFMCVLVTGIGIYGFIIKANLIEWFINWWFFSLLVILPILGAILGTANSMKNIKDIINRVPDEKFAEVLVVLNDFEIFGKKI